MPVSKPALDLRRVPELARALEHDDPVQRARALDTLWKRYPAAAATVPVVIDMLQDDHAGVREKAERTLWNMGGLALRHYTEYLEDAHDPARALARKREETILLLGGAATPPDLLNGSESAIAARRQSAAATSILWTLTGWDDPATLDVSVETLMADSDAGVRAMASASVALIGWCAVSDAYSATDVQMVGAVRVLRGKDAMARHLAMALCWMLQPRHDDALIDAVRAGGGALTEQVLERVAPDAKNDGETLAALKRAAQIGGASIALGPLFGRLQRMGPEAKAAVPYLLKLLPASKGFGTTGIARTLLAIDAASAFKVVPSLVELVRKPGDWDFLQPEALELLADAGPAAKDAISLYVEVLAWPEEDVAPLAKAFAEKGATFRHVLYCKRAAVRGLGACGSDAAGAKKALGALRDHPDARLRYRVSVALRRIS